MGKIRKRTPEEKARWQENHDRLRRLLDRRLQRERAAEAEAERQREARS